MIPESWADDHPFYILIVDDDRAVAIIDLGERGWLTTYADWMRRPGRWHLVRKTGNQIVGLMQVIEGEQPYYVARHVGVVAMGGDGTKHETIAYGIGKKRLDGHVDRLWFMANGAVTLGDDLETIAIDLLKAGQI